MEIIATGNFHQKSDATVKTEERDCGNKGGATVGQF